MNKNLKDKIIAAVVKGIQRNGDKVFSISQDTAGCLVPVNTGMLKKSGYTNYLPLGIEIGYRTPYAGIVETGIEQDIPIEGTQIVRVKSYRRRDGTIVKEHIAKYVNKRLIPIRPKFSKFEWGEKTFRVINKIKARPGQYFLSRAVMEGLKDLTKDIKFYLDRIGG